MQDRVTDHRISLTLHGVMDILGGEGLDDIITSLAVEETSRLLAVDFATMP